MGKYIMNKNKINIIIKSTYHRCLISPWNYLSGYHPYRIWYVLNICLASGIFIGSYAIGKGSIIILLSSNILFDFSIGSLLLLILLLLGIIYPLFWSWLIYPLIRSGSDISLIYRSYYSGSLISNIFIIFWSFFSILHFYFL